MSLDFCCDIQMLGSEFGVKNMDPSCLVSTIQAGGGGVIVWGMFSWHTLGPLAPIEHSINATAYLTIVADHVHLFMTTVYTSSDGYFQQDNAACHKAQISSDWFLEHDNEFTLLKWPPQSPDLNPMEHIWDVVEREIRIMDVQPTNLQQLRDAIMSIRTKISEECFQHLVEYMPQIIKAVLKAKVGYKMDLIKWPMSVYTHCKNCRSRKQYSSINLDVAGCHGDETLIVTLIERLEVNGL